MLVFVMQTVVDTPFTLTLKDAVQLIVFVAGLSAAWWRLTAKVNGFGERTTRAELDAIAAKTTGDKNSLELTVASAERAELRERMASAETAVDGLHDELSQERLAVMSTLHANEKAAAERDAKLREELARLTERVDINRIVRSVVSEFKRNES